MFQPLFKPLFETLIPETPPEPDQVEAAPVVEPEPATPAEPVAPPAESVAPPEPAARAEPAAVVDRPRPPRPSTRSPPSRHPCRTPRLDQPRHRAPSLSPAPVEPPAPVAAVEPPESAHTLETGLERTRGGFMSRLRGFLGGESEGPSWDDVEETLIAGDVGAALAMDLVERARRRRDPGGSEAAVRAELVDLLVPREAHWAPRPSVEGGPAIILIVGVNGTGKTTTIGKLTSRYVRDGRTVILAAADTFRAAASDQLRIWADRSGTAMIAHAPGADPERSSTTRSTPPSRGTRTSSSPTRPVACTRRATSWTS